MTTNEIILVLALALSITWNGIITVFAIREVKKEKDKVAYYQQPETQVKIMQHVLRQRQYVNGGEVFK